LCVHLTFSVTAIASDTDIQIRESLLNFASDEDAIRSRALKSLIETNDFRLDKILSYYRSGSLYVYNDTVVLCKEIIENEELDEFVVPLDVFTENKIQLDPTVSKLVAIEDVVPLEPDRNERKEISKARVLLGLSAEDANARLIAIRKIDPADQMDILLTRLDDIAANDTDNIVTYAASETAEMIRFYSEDMTVKLAAVKKLGDLKSVRADAMLKDAMDSNDISNELKGAIEYTVARIQTRTTMIEIYDIVKSGISSGSVLVLMALGLAITFGLMGVINMAHGEMMAIGAYTTYFMQTLFNHTPHHPVNSYYLFALPAAFLVTALVAGLLEALIVKRLYNRPLDSLLITYGIGLIVIQLIRCIYGDNRASNSPSWLQGGFEIFPEMSLAYNRIFIFILCVLCVLFVHLLMRYTTLGLKMRATIQNREMASAMGVNTRRVDSLTFMLGSGIAGVAGYALTTIGGITPDMGQNYIVDSFLVVVTGGVGNLMGVVCSGFGLGIINKVLEGTIFGAVWSKIIVLMLVIVFIQFKPSGLFSSKGRLEDV